MERNTKAARANDPQRGATGSPCVSYAPREGATPEGELAALAAVYRYCLFQRPEQRKATEVDFGQKGVEHDLVEDLATSVDFGQKEKHEESP